MIVIRKLLAYRLVKVLLILFAIYLVFSVMQFLAFKQHTQSWYFQDETDHVTMGWMMNSYNKDLYLDLSTNHQPLPILFSAVVLRFFSYNTLYLLIEGLRTSMFIFGFISSCLLIARFRLAGLLSSILIQTATYLFLGFHILAESLVVYAIAGLILYVLEYAQKKDIYETIFLKIDSIIIGILMWWSAFNLVPLLPFLAGIGLFFLYNLPKKSKLIFILTILLATAILAFFIHPLAWYEETIFNNLNYFFSPTKESTILQSILLPVTVLSSNHYLSKIFLSFFICLFFVIICLREQRRSYLSILLMALFCFLTLNFRVSKLPQHFYQMFHLFPLVSAFLTLIAYSVAQSFAQKQKYVKLVLICVFLFLVNQNTWWWFEKKDKILEYGIQYNRFEDYGRIINSLRGNATNETLFTGPDGHGYINMIGLTPLAGRQNFHLPWAWRSPKLREEFYALFNTTPPTYIYFTFDGGGYSDSLEDIIANSYTRVYTVENKATNLYIHNNKVATLNQMQLDDLARINLFKLEK